MPQQRLAKAVRILLVLILLVVILVYAKPFLVPLAFAGVLSLLLLPITRWLERRGINKAVATLLTLLAFLSVFAALFFFIGWQLSGITEDASQMEQQFSQKLQQLKSSISKTFGVSPQKQQQIIKQQQQQAPGKTSAFITGLLSGIGLFLTNTILMLVYLFLLLYYRGHLKTAILKFVPESERGNAEVIMHDSQQVTYKYITGLGLMIVSLWIMYGIGFSIAGVKNPLFFAVLCGVLEIIPFVGNLAGTLLTMGMALSQGGSTNMLIGIAVTYGVVQFIQSYLIEPLVVGSKVNINPLFTIAAIVAGEQVWGIPGMILSIPLLGMAKIICDRVAPLRPIGFLIGEDHKKEKGKGNSLMDKIKKMFAKAPQRTG